MTGIVKKLPVLIVLLISLQNIYAVDVTEKNIEAFIRTEYNRTFNFYGDISITGTLELNNMFNFKAGFSFGGSSGITDIRAFAKAKVSPFSNLPLSFEL
jgi:hypothetical protein